MIRFLHTADLHIDSPLKGLEEYPGAPAERIRFATRQAMENLVRLALDERVQFVVIAGDMFDGEWKVVESRLWVTEQFKRLAAAGIQVVTLRGNHDAANRTEGILPWPDNVHEFSVDHPETIVFENLRVALHGQGYPSAAVWEDLTEHYPQATPGMTNIGVLHTSLAGHPNHDSYAPTTVGQLHSKGYDYWALGHIHTREVVQENRPAIVFPGNPQGRHIRETGAKGCYLVEIEDGTTRMEFHPTDVLRWELVESVLSEECDLEHLFASVEARVRDATQQSENRFLALRLQISGSCQVHDELQRNETREAAVARIRQIGLEHSDKLWIEKVRIDTTPPLNRAALARGNDLFAELLRAIDEIAASDRELKLMAEDFSGLRSKAGTQLDESGVKMDDPDELRRWLRNAESLLYPLIAKTNEEES